MRTKLAALRKDRRGAAAIELSAIAPFLILMLIGLGDIGRFAYKKMQVQHAANAGGRYAALNGYNATAISNAVSSATASTQISASPTPSQFCGCATTTGITTATCSSTCSSGQTAGTYVKVSSSMSFRAVFNPPLLSYPSTITGQMTVRIQ